MQRLIYFSAVAFLVTLTQAFAQNNAGNSQRTGSIILANTFHLRTEGRETSFYYNPLTIDGKPLDYATFSIASQGMLAVVTGNPESPEATKIPFRIYLQRGNQQIHALAGMQPLYTVDVARILAVAKVGDHLVIEPIHKSDWRGKRIIKVVDYGMAPLYMWLPLLTKRGDGC